MKREEFDKLVEETTDLTLDRFPKPSTRILVQSSSVDAWSSVRL
ncbi:MAG TPA: hypothetical protein VHN56_07800 [Actinomycetota bacterium]|jgi:hypothetical protein|nr:hypothetical protein [Actinomycetota bacterium]